MSPGPEGFLFGRGMKLGVGVGHEVVGFQCNR